MSLLQASHTNVRKPFQSSLKTALVQYRNIISPLRQAFLERSNSSSPALREFVAAGRRRCRAFHSPFVREQTRDEVPGGTQRIIVKQKGQSGYKICSDRATRPRKPDSSHSQSQSPSPRFLNCRSESECLRHRRESRGSRKASQSSNDRWR